MSYADEKVVVYIGYPSEVLAKPPSWIDSVLRAEAQDAANSSFRFFLSGGSLTPQLLELLKSRSSSQTGAQLMSLKLAQGYTSRLVDALLSPEIEKLAILATENPLSTEYRILLDLWVLSRSDVYVVDCDLLGRARCGMEAVYAHHCVKTVGVSDSPVQDPWYQYHLDAIVKSQMCLTYLRMLRPAVLASRARFSDKSEPAEESGPSKQ